MICTPIADIRRMISPPSPTFLRRFVVVDDTIAPVLAGATPERLDPSDVPLDPDVVDEVRRLVAENDFTRVSVATGLVDVRFAVRVTRRSAGDAVYYGVAIERARLAVPLGAASVRYGLSPLESETLRLVVGGYERNAIARRLQLSIGPTRDLLAALRTKLACQTRTDFITLVERCRTDRAPAPRRVAAQSGHLG